MASGTSKKLKSSAKSKSTDSKSGPDSASPNSTFKSGLKTTFYNKRAKIWQKKSAHPRYHKSFKRSYREDYIRKLEVPGLVAHTAHTFRAIFKHWRTFLLLIILTVIVNVLLVGLMSEETYQEYQDTVDSSSIELGGEEGIGNFAKAGLLLISTITTGGLSADSSDTSSLFTVITFLMLWLVTIFLLRHYLVGHRPKLRDALYNAGAPVISTFCVLLIIFIQLIPIFIVIIAYSAAVSTEFLATPFYALLFFIFAAIMILLSCYLISSSLMALVAVTAPGLYPLVAVRTASDFMAGRRVRFLIRIFYLIVVLALIWAIVMIPIILLDLQLKSSFDWLSNWPIVSIFLQIMTCFSMIFAAAYFYLYYRRILAYDQRVAKELAEISPEAQTTPTEPVSTAKKSRRFHFRRRSRRGAKK